MNVLMIGPHQRLNGGVASVTSDLLCQFQNDTDITIMSLATINSKSKSRYPDNFARFLVALVWRSLSGKFDIAHIHLASKGSTYRKVVVMALLRMLGKKYLVHLHGAKFDRFFLSLPKPIAFLVTHYLSQASFVVALSRSWETWLKGNLKLENTQVITNGAPSAMRKIDASIYSKKFVCLFAGRLDDRKGPHELLKACSAPPLKGQIEIWFAGDGNYERYESLARDLDLSEDCRFLGWLQREDFYQRLNQADVFVLPSFAEGMPISIIEAMSAGIPVISTKVGGIPELVHSGETGILIEAGDTAALHHAIKKMFEDPSVRSGMAQASLELYESRFSAVEMKSRFKELYQAMGSKP